jgi:hypothetical protein
MPAPPTRASTARAAAALALSTGASALTGTAGAAVAAGGGGAACRAPSPVSVSNIGGRQLRGTGHGAELWALLFFSPPARVGQEQKIVWRMTGHGPFKLAALGPGHRTLAPAWGPVLHGGSNWDKPGQEWGSAFVFPVPGCWDVHARRTGATGDVRLTVVK